MRDQVIGVEYSLKLSLKKRADCHMQKPSILRSVILLFFIVGISLFHYLTPLHLPYLHDIFQRLYYIPIILAAFWFGFRGGLACSIFVSIVYAPHLLFQWGGPPSMEMEKYLEVLLYNIVGGVTGFLSHRERERATALQMSEENLRGSYDSLLAQSEKIRVIEEQLRKAERLSAVGEMSAVLVHEIKNPLTSIRGYAEYIRKGFKPNEKYHEFLTIMIKEVDRLNTTAMDFLRFSKPVIIRPEACNVLEELNTIVAMVSQEAGQRRAQVTLVTEPLPITLADCQKLRQAFLNLIQNARQAAGCDGSVTIAAAVERYEDREHIVMYFDDNGAGIPQEIREKLFEPFFTTKTDGTGLGLSTTRKIIEEHDGTIEVDVAPAGGARFIVRIPVLQPDM